MQHYCDTVTYSDIKFPPNRDNLLELCLMVAWHTRDRIQETLKVYSDRQQRMHIELLGPSDHQKNTPSMFIGS